MTATRHLLVSALVGAIAGMAAGFTVDPALGLLVAWGVAASVFLALTWASVWSLDAATTAQVASRQDPSRGALPARREGYGHLALGVACIIASWLLVHTVFALKYARLFYAPPQGGIDFKQSEPPTNRDFAYVAFTVGMTFQVADTDTQDTTVRLTVLRPALSLSCSAPSSWQ